MPNTAPDTLPAWAAAIQKAIDETTAMLVKLLDGIRRPDKTPPGEPLPWPTKPNGRAVTPSTAFADDDAAPPPRELLAKYAGADLDAMETVYRLSRAFDRAGGEAGVGMTRDEFVALELRVEAMKAR